VKWRKIVVTNIKAEDWEVSEGGNDDKRSFRGDCRACAIE
jgi:hypothetical protein